DEGGITANMRVDQIDNVNLPREGYLSDVNFVANRESLGGTTSYNRLDGKAVGVQTWGRWTGLVKVEGGEGFGSPIPFYDQFELGGLFRLSGRPFGQLTGDTYAFGALLAYYRLTGTGGAIIKGIYAGVSLEAGNTWDTNVPVSWRG